MGFVSLMSLDNGLSAVDRGLVSRLRPAGPPENFGVAIGEEGAGEVVRTCGAVPFGVRASRLPLRLGLLDGGLDRVCVLRARTSSGPANRAAISFLSRPGV